MFVVYQCLSLYCCLLFINICHSIVVCCLLLFVVYWCCIQASFGQASVAAYDPLYHSTTSESIVLGEAPPNSARRCC